MATPSVPCAATTHVSATPEPSEYGTDEESGEETKTGEPNPTYGKPPKGSDEEEKETPERLEIRLSDGRARRIRYIKSDMFWGADGKPVAADDFLRAMFGDMPRFFNSLHDLKEKWSSPKTRETLLEQMAEAGYDRETLCKIRTLIDADDSDLLDVLEYVSFNVEPINREERARRTEEYVSTLTPQQKDFVLYMLQLYINVGMDELGKDKLPELLKLKYGSPQDGMNALGGMEMAKSTFYGVQRSLYLN